ncbi:MAG: hypothetical protein AB8B64_13325 [Granulosicoccus sp.]
MGKTYKTQAEDDYLDDLFEDDMDMDIDFEESMDMDLDIQGSGNSSRRAKGNRGSKKTTAYDDEYSQYRLPRDWQDFDYTTESPLSDYWR